MEGILKQQCVDEQGLYSWQKKFFKVAESGLLHVGSSADSTTTINLSSAKYAKEWSFASALSGYGFDIYWSTGNIWSFLVDTELNCMNWVMAINDAVKLSSAHAQSSPGRYIASRSLPALPPPAEFESDSADRFAQTVAQHQLFLSQSYPKGGGNNEDGLIGSGIVEAKSPHDRNSTEDLPLLRSTHPPSRHHQSQSRYSSTQQSQEDEEQVEYDFIPSAPPVAPPIRTDEQRNAYIDSMKSIFATTKQTLASTEQELRRSNPIVASDPMQITLQIRCQHLEQQLQSKQHELENAQRKIFETRLALEEQLKSTQDELDEVKQREHDLLSKFKHEIDHRVLRASNENNSYFEASIKQLKSQHVRELRVLQEELSETRKESQQTIDKEISLRKRCESHEQACQHELQAAQDRITSLEIDLHRLQNTVDNSQAAWSREKSRLIAEYTSQITALQAEKDEIETSSQHKLQQKITEMNKKFEHSLSNLKSSEIETLRREWEGDHARALIELQKKCQRDIEQVRAEERTLLAQEIENIRNAFLSREHQTASDLIELEKLHAKRVQQLEMQFTAEKTQCEELREKLADLMLNAELQRHDVQYKHEQWSKKHGEYILHNDQMKRELQSLQDQLTEARSNENKMREQLRQTSMENKLIQAERSELQRQASSSSAEALQWRKVVAEQERNFNTAETSTRVAKEEVTLLEHENQRLKQENIKLRGDLERSERLIYGVSQQVGGGSDARRSAPVTITHTAAANNNDNSAFLAHNSSTASMTNFTPSGYIHNPSYANNTNTSTTRKNSLPLNRNSSNGHSLLASNSRNGGGVGGSSTLSLTNHMVSPAPSSVTAMGMRRSGSK